MRNQNRKSLSKQIFFMSMLLSPFLEEGKNLRWFEEYSPYILWYILKIAAMQASNLIEACLSLVAKTESNQLGLFQSKPNS
jgi:hypothetical protein